MVNGGGFTIMTANLKIENTFGETEKDGLKDITTQGGRNGQQSLSQQNSIFGGLKFLCEFKLFGEGPSGFRTTFAILLLNNHYFLPIVRRSPP